MVERNKYNFTKVYKLFDQINQYFYIGSTISTLDNRLRLHKRDSKINNSKVYTYFNLIGWNNVKIVLIEEHCLENRNQQMRVEDNVIMIHIDNEKCLNSYRAQQNKTEWKKNHKFEIYNYNKMYCAEHSQHVKEYMAAYREKNKTLLKENKRKYYILNKDRIKEKQREYFENCKQKLTCICGSVIASGSKASHEKTKNHQNNLCIKDKIVQ